MIKPAGDKAGLDPHGVRQCQAQTILRVETLHFGHTPVVGKRDEADAPVGERAVNIHQEKLDLPGAFEQSGTGERIIWHESDLIVFNRGKL